jgi:TldD protein
MKHNKPFFPAVVIVLLLIPSLLFAAKESPLVSAMKKELDRSFGVLKSADEIPLYYLSYHASDLLRKEIAAEYGAITTDEDTHERILDIVCRVGDHKLDNTHEIRGEWDYGYYSRNRINLPLENDELAIRTIIWQNTDEEYKRALERYTKVSTNEQVLVEKEDTSADFSVEKSNIYAGKPVAVSFDSQAWKEKLKRWSAIFKEYSFVQNSSVQLLLSNDNRYFVDSDGARIQTGQSYARLFLRCSGACDDGMVINRSQSFDATTPGGFPAEAEIEDNIYRLIEELRSLLNAPPAEPYTGPAILLNRASGVFFHEIFGHRIEGHRQKSESEGQTFARKLGESILPDFIDIYDDPTMKEFDKNFLRGYYLYDDEGVKSERVTVVDKGVLKNFLMSRSPINNFPHSNGHGRKQPGRQVVARQGNLIVESSRQFPYDTLLTMLIDECRKQDKPYGLIFNDISGGFTMTGRSGPQSFKVIPLLVYRIYQDGSLEAIRGVDIVGTPLSSFEKIMATGDDYDIFNGTCGAESGWVPVSAVSPSILVSQVEIEKKAKEQEKPPILGPPYKPANPQSNH